MRKIDRRIKQIYRELGYEIRYERRFTWHGQKRGVRGRIAPRYHWRIVKRWSRGRGNTSMAYTARMRAIRGVWPT